MPTETVVVSAARTPIGRFGGALRDVAAADLGAVAIRDAVRRAAPRRHRDSGSGYGPDGDGAFGYPIEASGARI
ncbi:hypothetical protein SY88_20625 [Clostridiales bacterium PH28_bin88]|nr:hypothetical protein SY88_20625 [Clostridiales bacterium PH28_bin88]